MSKKSEPTGKVQPIKLELATFELFHIKKALEGRLDDLHAINADKEYDDCQVLLDKIESYLNCAGDVSCLRAVVFQAGGDEMRIELSVDTNIVQGTDRESEDLFLVVEGELQGGFLPDLEKCLELVAKGEYSPEFLQAVDSAIEQVLDVPTCETEDEIFDHFEDETNGPFYQKDGFIISAETELGFKVKYKREYLFNTLRHVLLRGDWVKDFRTKRLFVKKDILVDGNSL